MQLPIGRHIRACRGPYAHHGIYIGRGLVIHFTGLGPDKGNAVIKVDSINTFANGDSVECIGYSRAFAPGEVLKRARSRLGQNGYDLFGNNCEHFARWCMVGDHHSNQVHRAGSYAAGAGGSSATAVAGVAVALGAAAPLRGGARVMTAAAKAGRAVGFRGAAGGVGVLAAAPTLAATVAVHQAYRDDPVLAPSERGARKAARNAASTTAVVGMGGSVLAVAAAGVPGLSAIGISTGLASIGAFVGGGMLAGLVVVAGVPAAVVLLVGSAAYRRRLQR